MQTLANFTDSTDSQALLRFQQIEITKRLSRNNDFVNIIYLLCCGHKGVLWKIDFGKILAESQNVSVAVLIFGKVLTFIISELLQCSF